MALEMKSRCESCDSDLGLEAEALICSFECTFCPACGEFLMGRCPNCGGELVKRPRRRG